ncbi:MAG: HNH endonuclease, partial [Chthoniobacteraceae bacterium]
MLRILVGNSSSDRELLHNGAEAGKLQQWVVPKTALVGDAAVFFIRPEGFVARGVIHTRPKPHSSWPGKYGAAIRSVTMLAAPVPIDLVQEKMPEWGWPLARTLSYTSITDNTENQLLALLDSYQAPSATQETSDLPQLPQERVPTITDRILRDTELARRVKSIHRSECQICGHTIQLPNGARYAEAHHIQPLGTPHNGPDILSNILCLCP